MVVLIAFAILVGIYFLIAVLPAKAYGELLFTTHQDDGLYFLFAPHPRNGHVLDEKKVFLLDRQAKIYHEWNLPRITFSVALDAQENLWALHFASNPTTEIRGELDELAEYSWDNRPLRSLKGFTFSHDFEVIDENSIAAITLEKIDEKLRQRLKLNTNSKGFAYSDRLIILDGNGNVSWSWRLTDHLDELNFKPGSVDDFELSHSNSIRYLKENPITSTPAFLLSIRNMSRVILIEIETKKVIWASPEGLVKYQHDASLLKNGNILVFDNGFRGDEVLSRVIEIDIRTNSLSWSYNGGGNWRFMVPVMGSAQRLDNGNTLITTGSLGQIFEVAPDQKIAWNYLLPIKSESKLIQTENFWQGHAIYRARAYNLGIH